MGGALEKLEGEVVQAEGNSHLVTTRPFGRGKAQGLRNGEGSQSTVIYHFQEKEAAVSSEHTAQQPPETERTLLSSASSLTENRQLPSESPCPRTEEPFCLHVSLNWEQDGTSQTWYAWGLVCVGTGMLGVQVVTVENWATVPILHLTWQYSHNTRAIQRHFSGNCAQWGCPPFNGR